MKKTKVITLLIVVLVCLVKGQDIYPLTETKIPQGAYKKDTKDELPAFEGMWKGSWKDKTIIIQFKKRTKIYKEIFKYYQDYIIGKFQVRDKGGKILFNNIDVVDNKAKIYGGRMFPSGKYSLVYNDYDLCGMGGLVDLSFTDSSKTKLKLYYMPMSMLIAPDCIFHGKEIPEPLPVREELILTKQ